MPNDKLPERLCEARKRSGLSQRELAKASGVSLSLIRKIEQGERDSARMETLRKLAASLRLPTTQLAEATRAASGTRAADVGTLDLWGPVRSALQGPPQKHEEPPTAEGVASAVAAAQSLFAADRYADLAAVLPSLIADSEALVEVDPGTGRSLRFQLMHLTGWLLTQNRQLDIAGRVLDRHIDDAGDRLQGAGVVNTRCWVFLRQGNFDAALNLAEIWADKTEPRVSQATMSELSAWGYMLLRVSAAAVRDNRPWVADDALRLARSAAVAMGREHAPQSDLLRTFGPVTVMLKQAENAAIVEDYDKVLKLAARIPSGGVRPTSSNFNRHRLDVSNAYAHLRRYGEAVETLHQVYVDSPEWLPQQQYAQDILGRVVRRRRTLTPEMRQLAEVLRLPL